MKPFLVLSVSFVLMALVVSPAVASCRINLTVSINPWWNDTAALPDVWAGRPARLVNGTYYTTDYDPVVEIELETQRRLGQWEHAFIHPRPGYRVDARVVQPSYGVRPGSNQRIYSNRITSLNSTDRRTLPSQVALVADLDGAGCVADRQFRITTRCRLSPTGERAHRSLHGRNYRPLAQPRVDVLFGGNRVAPQAITRSITCPAVGPLR